MENIRVPKLVLLDRDGVINEDRPDSVKSVAEFVLYPRVAEGIERLNRAQIPVVIVTNQAVVGRGTISEETLAEIHTHMHKVLDTKGAHIQKIYVCTSADNAHPDRKPNPGLLKKAFQDFAVSPEEGLFIGDALRDLEAASAVACPRCLVQTGKGRKTLEEGLPDYVQPVTLCKDLWTAVEQQLGG